MCQYLRLFYMLDCSHKKRWSEFDLEVPRHARLKLLSSLADHEGLNSDQFLVLVDALKAEDEAVVRLVQQYQSNELGPDASDFCAFELYHMLDADLTYSLPDSNFNIVVCCGIRFPM